MGLKDLVTNTIETRERHKFPELKSRYYKSNYNKSKLEVLAYAKLNNLEVKHLDDAHKEVFLQHKKYHIIVSFIQVTPIETSIDFKVEVYSFIGFGKPKKLILEFYKYLDSKLPFKGAGLHP